MSNTLADLTAGTKSLVLKVFLFINSAKNIAV
jgi:hypothetical protein